MAIEKTVEPYEILIRFRKDEKGETIIAGQMQSLQKIVMDGELIKEDILPPQELDLAALPTSQFMREAQADAINQATRLFAENNILKLQLAQLEAKLRAEWGAEVAAHKETIRSFANDARVKNEMIATQEKTISELAEASTAIKPGVTEEPQA
ncbi:hypothetical protein [Agrobacterium rosae]|uniref:hypothetical protein n=1 Tax=Agrobacterium rosae TaxID=1972867 RepID=UPI00122F883C|nr:hypothetical protein [Agrobacterium rosae]KAA3510090.1 hypothetical protein DXM21_19870 [Agrobacterium rosae]KAA3514965.1 hypothetical protein DXM25_20500 [Agrobacterium rosae]MQB50710.1 hypothetical protein [Agrobacterium rosae]